MKTVWKYSYLLLFLAMLIVPLALINTQPDYISETDNRELTDIADFSELGITGGVRNYLQDRIGFRDEMLTGYQVINTAVSGELIHPIYTYGKDGYVFFKMHNNNSYNGYHKIFANAVLKMREYCGSRGVPFYFVFNPEKISVYRDYLPSGVNYTDEWVDHFLASLEENGVTVVDNRKLLSDLSKTEQVFNRQYDAGHWNDLGCYYGTNNLWRAMQEYFPETGEYTQDDFEISTKTGTYLANSRFPVNETIPDYRLKASWQELTDQYEGIRLDSRYRYFQYCRNQEENAGQYPKIMVFQGSYYNSRYQFLIGRASDYIGIHDYQNVLNLDYYFNIFQPDAVVFEVAEYTFSSDYFDWINMGSIDYHPELIIADPEYSTRLTQNATIRLTQRNGFDSVFLDASFLAGELPTSGYAYLTDGDSCYDLFPDQEGGYSADIPGGAVSGEMMFYFLDKEGNEYYTAVSAE